MCLFPRSSVQSILQPIDCRRLTLSVHYYFLNQDAVCSLVGDILQWLREFAEEHFVFCWYHNGKNIAHKRVMTVPSLALFDKEGFRFGFDAYVTNPVTHNAATVRQYQKSLQSIYPEYQFRLHTPSFATGCSVDYPEHFDALFPNTRLENSQIIERILKIFYARDRKLLSFHKEPDLIGQINANPYDEHPDLYYGSVSISFSAFCLNASVNKVADTLAQFARVLSETYGQINAQVCLQPKEPSGHTGASPYMRYFGKNLTEDGSCEKARCNPKEWYHAYYLCGVEWMNILSPLTKQHLGDSLPEDIRSDIDARELISGALLVKSVKPITEYTIEDALAIKDLVLPALYPGKTAVPLRAIYPWQGMSRVYAWCPRNDWAIVPIEKTELDIIGTDIVFCSKSSICRN